MVYKCANVPGTCQRAPFRVQDVEHVVVTPFWHLMHAATHCLKSFASYDGKRSLSHLFVLPVTLAGEHETERMAKPKRTTMRAYEPPKLERPIKQVGSARAHPLAGRGKFASTPTRSRRGFRPSWMACRNNRPARTLTTVSSRRA